MRSVLFEIPLPGGASLPLHGYGLMILLGFCLAIWVAAREARRRGLPDFVYDLGLVMLLSGLFGGRLNYYVQFYDRYRDRSILEFFKIWEGGLVFYGGAVFGLLGGWVFLKRRRLPVPECLDVAALGVPLAMAFGRLGCFLHGCCYGRLCDPGSPVALVFPPGSPAHDQHLREGLISAFTDPALPVLPIQLLQFAHDLLVFGLLFVYLRRVAAPRGAAMPLLFVLYGIGRFCLEGLRGDHRLTFTGWTFSQNVSVVLIAVFGTVLAILYTRAMGRARGRPAELGNPG